MRVTLILCLLSCELVLAGTEFTPLQIPKYFTRNNPFVYETLAQEQIIKQKEIYYRGNFDTKLSAKYDNKEYALSQGEFLDLTVEKPIENGMEFLVGYRKASGIQEYNNIKTGEEGELRLGMKVPVSSVLMGMNERELLLKSASLESQKLHLGTEDNLRLFYFKVLSEYYKLLYGKNLFLLEQNLLDTAKKREAFVRKKVTGGALPEVALIEARQQILNREQRLIYARNSFEKMLEIFVMYLGITRQTFESRYTLPSLKLHEKRLPSLSRSIEYAMQNRPDLDVFDYTVKQQKLQKEYTRQMNYPDVTMALYGVRDIKYGNGYKVSMNMDFPLERRKYRGKNEEIKMHILQIQNSKNKKIAMIKSTLSYIVNSMKSLKKNIVNANKEILAAKKLELAEKKKYKLGLSTLFLLNMREIYTLEVRKKYLHYILEYLLLEQAIKQETGKKVPQSIDIK